jgi:hypothetical protein
MNQGGGAAASGGQSVAPVLHAKQPWCSRCCLNITLQALLFLSLSSRIDTAIIFYQNEQRRAHFSSKKQTTPQ